MQVTVQHLNLSELGYNPQPSRDLPPASSHTRTSGQGVAQHLEDRFDQTAAEMVSGPYQVPGLVAARQACRASLPNRRACRTPKTQQIPVLCHKATQQSANRNDGRSSVLGPFCATRPQGRCCHPALPSGCGGGGTAVGMQLQAAEPPTPGELHAPPPIPRLLP